MAQAFPTPIPVNPALRPRTSVLAGVIATAAIVLPCWWTARVEAGDVASHTYNAWLANNAGRFAGLSLARQYTNVLYDLLLAQACRWFGYGIGERIAVSLVAAILFWGLLSLTAGRGTRWWIAPAIAMLTYSWTFHMGLMNFCLSAGFSALALGMWMRRGARGSALAIPLLAVAWLAHLLPVLIVLGCGGYALLHRHLRERQRMLLLVSALAAMVLARQILMARYVVMLPKLDLRVFLGVNQLVIYTAQYRWVGYATVILLWAGVVIAGRGRMREVATSAPAQLAIVFTLATVTLPTAMQGFSSSVSFVVERLSIIMPLCACVLLAWERPPKGIRIAIAVLAAMYFGMLWRDARVLNQIEDQLTAAVRQAPQNSRVLELMPYGDNTTTILHMVDRACVGHCFSYANYEPGSGQFRVRAAKGSGIVVDNYPLSYHMQLGDYVVQGQDLPLYEVFLCDRATGKFCLREMRAGQRLGEP